MADRKKILAISGSTRMRSSNAGLLQAIGELYSGRMQFTVFDGLTQLPHFNPDRDTDTPPEAVGRFRKAVKEADGVLICTPEYAMGVPGTLKNAIDWTVSSMDFSRKPTALITASSQGYKGHASLTGTLRIIEAEIPCESQLVVPFVKTKIRDNRITDETTLAQVKGVIDSLIKEMDKVEQTNAFRAPV